MRLFLFLLCLPIVGLAQNWTGAINSDWNNAANWSTWPLNGADITIDPATFSGVAAMPVIASNSVFSPGMVLVQNGAVLTIQANLTTQDDFEVLGAGTHVEMDLGTVQVNPGNGGRLIVDLGATWTMDNGNLQVDERFIAGEDAVITINGGTAATGERLLMDLGGAFVQNGGVVNVAAVFAMADGNANGNSSYTLNNGTLNITGEMAFENEAGNFEPTFTQNGGTVTLNGDLFWFGMAPGLGTPRMKLYGGTFSANGLIENMVASTVNLYLLLDGNAQFNYSGSIWNLLHATDSIIQRGNAQLNFTGTATITNPGVFWAENGVETNFMGQTTLNGTGSYQFATIDLGTAKTLTLNQSIAFSKNIYPNGNFVANTHTVTANGSGSQEILGSQVLNLYNLTEAQAAGQIVKISSNTSVNNHLQLNSGYVQVPTTAVFSLSDNATSSTGSPASFIDGTCTKIGNDAFLFPLGHNGFYAPLSIGAPSLVNCVFEAKYTAPTPNNTNVISPLSSVFPSGFWTVNNPIGASSVPISLHWYDATQSAVFDCANVTVAQFNGTAWAHLVSTASGLCSGNNAGYTTTVNPTSSFGNFTLGYFGNVYTQQYEICAGDSVLINGNYYGVTTTLVDNYLDINGDDSTVIVQLNVLPVFNTTQNIARCFGESYSIGNNTYSFSGTYIDTLQATNGCDSIVTTNLQVLSQLTFTLDITNGIVSVQEFFDSIIWLDCTTGNVVSAGQTFTPLTNGTYAAIGYFGLCYDTSACFVYDQVGLEDWTQTLVIAPNPTNERIQISLQETPILEFELRNMTGEILPVSVSAVNGGYEIRMEQLPQGVYLLTLRTNRGSVIRKIHKV